MIASAPSYRPRKKKPPAVKPGPVIRRTQQPITSKKAPAPKRPKVKAPVARSPVAGPAATTQPPVPAPFTPATVPTPQVTPPPAPTLQSESDRIGAREGYGFTMNDANSQLRSLAAQFGLAPKVVQFGYDPNSNADTQTDLGVAANQPGSTADVLMRNLQGQQRNIDETSNSGNTYFSSRRLQDRGLAETDYGAQLAQAQRAYDEAIASLTNSILQARSSRQGTFRLADIADIESARAAEPEAQSGPLAPAPPPPGMTQNPYGGFSPTTGTKGIKGSDVGWGLSWEERQRRIRRMTGR